MIEAKKTETTLYFTYHFIDAPRGGANSFVRALHKTLQHSDMFELLEIPAHDCDMLFMVSYSCGTALRRLYKINFDGVKKMQKRGTKVIVRAMDLHRNPESYFGNRGYKIRKPIYIKNVYTYIKKDRKILSLLKMADHVIFQSKWQKDMFTKYGFKGSSWSVVHNGASDIFSPAETLLPQSGKLKVLSSSTSINTRHKRHPLMAELSEIEGVEMHYAGYWPDSVDPKKVHLHGVLSHDELADLWKTMHYCFHPAICDLCPNAVCEALASGVPVIYNPNGGGTVELASMSGIALQENNLASTIEEARERYNELAESARLNSEYYTINRACDEYVDIFKRYA